jgi:hypothetical protein
VRTLLPSALPLRLPKTMRQPARLPDDFRKRITSTAHSSFQ